MLSMIMPQVVAGRSPLAERRDNQQTVGAAIAPPVPAPERRRRKRGGRGARGRGSQNLERPPVQVCAVGAQTAYALVDSPCAGRTLQVWRFCSFSVALHLQHYWVGPYPCLPTK